MKPQRHTRQALRFYCLAALVILVNTGATIYAMVASRPDPLWPIFVVTAIVLWGGFAICGCRV